MNHNHSADQRPPTSALVIGALGVVFGDIGTSPLYALKESVAQGSGAEAELFGIPCAMDVKVTEQSPQHLDPGKR